MKELFVWTLTLTEERVVEVALAAGIPAETIPLEGVIVTSRGDGCIGMLVAPNQREAEDMRPSALEAAIELQGVARLSRFVWERDVMRAEESDGNSSLDTNDE
jgi:hypothetical protein